jgi:hypothetical protein
VTVPASLKQQRRRESRKILSREILREFEEREAAKNNPIDFKEANGEGGLTGQRLDFWQCSKRFQVVAAGRRSGKTLLAEWKLEQRLWEKKPWPDARYFFAGPTQGQAEQIGWRRMIDRIEASPNASKISKINYSDLIVTVDLGIFDKQLFQASFHIIGLDSPQRMEGRGWDGGIGDERADWKAGIFGAHIRPALADRKGFLWEVGTPDFEAPSSHEFYEDFQRGISGELDWQSFTWLSADVVDRNEIESARKDSSPEIFRQEYEASWESAPGRAYPNFVRAVHVHPTDYNSNYPLLISCDFNRKYHNWGEYQFYEGRYKILNDIFVLGGTTEAMCVEAKSRLRTKQLPENGKGVVFYGDYSGEQKRAEATEASWKQVRKEFPSAMFAYAPQPPVTDRLEKVNAFILNASKESHVDVDPKALNHIIDFEKVSRTMAFAGDGGRDGELTHASSAFGYLVWQTQKPRPDYFSRN